MNEDGNMSGQWFGFSRRGVLGAIAAAPFISMPAFAASPRGRLMVQGRPQDSGSNYRLNNILRAMDQLGGVRLMRCREPYTRTVGWNTYLGLARAGVRFCFTLSDREPERSLADLRAFVQAAPGAIWAIEYPNEPDLNPVRFNGVRDARLGFRHGMAPSFLAYVNAMHTLFAADPQLCGIPLIASNDYMQFEQARVSNLGNSHIYPREGSNVGQLLAEFRAKVHAGGHRQGVITEWGRTTGGGMANVTAPPVSLDRQAELIAADLKAIFADPTVAAVSLYELFCWPGPSEQNNFGLFAADLRPNPVVAAIRGIIA